MKKQILFYFLTFSFCGIVTSCKSDDDFTPDEVLEAKTELNVSYGNNSQRVYDIYLPEDRSIATTKTIILIHGGGWTGGDKQDMSHFISLLQETNPDHAIVNMNYVLSNSTTPAFPNQFFDVGRVILKLTEEQEDLQIKPEFGLVGASAGAHIAMMYDYEYDATDQVKFVANIVGPSDFTDPFYANNPNFEVLLNSFINEDAYPPGTDLAEAVSPALQVTADSSPTILFYGNQDPLVPLSNGQTLNDKLQENSIPHSFTIYNGGHGDWSANDYLDLRAKLNTFIQTHLGI